MHSFQIHSYLTKPAEAAAFPFWIIEKVSFAAEFVSEPIMKNELPVEIVFSSLFPAHFRNSHQTKATLTAIFVQSRTC